jgi:hypothetical protein
VLVSFVVFRWDAHKRLTSQWSEPPFAPVVLLVA